MAAKLRSSERSAQTQPLRVMPHTANVLREQWGPRPKGCQIAQHGLTHPTQNTTWGNAALLQCSEG